MELWKHIEHRIGQVTGTEFSIAEKTSIAGGDINRAFKIQNNEGQAYFVKTNQVSLLDMFKAEFAGLLELHHSHSIRIPKPMCYGSTNNQAYIVLEWIDFKHTESSTSFGEQLACLHKTTQQQFGWSRDNTIGSTAQINTLDDDWVSFWRNNRLGFQLQLAANNGYTGSLQKKGEILLQDFPLLFSNYQPEASLLHGDLWSGNHSTDEHGQPIIFDPAVYYGDRETDMAMTELFGGPGQSFYDAYNASWPLDSGYVVRKVFYNLYHILNHLNLFAGGYDTQAENMMDRLLAEI